MENNDTLEVIQRIPLDKLRPYPDHPFGVRDDDMMQQTVESIKQFGVLVPGIARPLPDGSFELIAGHRRKQASAIAGLTDMPMTAYLALRNIEREERRKKQMQKKQFCKPNTTTQKTAVRTVEQWFR